MSSQNPYDQLGVTEASSFEEIQDARNRLCTEHQGDRKQIEMIEAAYDAVLMDRLRLRQEGKIKVPDRIRFPEKAAPAPPSPAPVATRETPNWLRKLIDTPSPVDVWLPGAILGALAVLVFFVRSSPVLPNVLQLALVGAVGSSLYFLFRKERKLGRAVLLGMSGLILGFVVGGLLVGLLQTQLLALGLQPEVIVSIFTFFILWLVSSFLR